MKIERWYPVLESSDDGLTVYRALRSSIEYWNEHMSSDVAWMWTKKALDAEGIIGDCFGIVDDMVEFPRGRDAPLYISTDELELALVNYGCELLDQNKGINNEAVLAVDGLLREIDKVRE